MIIKKARVFVNNEKIDNREILGNPASVVILEKNEMIDKKTKSRIAIKENQPITSFVKQINNNNFNIEYFFPNGNEINFCGHGTLATSKVLKDFYNIEDNITFYFNKELFSDKINNVVNVVFNKENLFTLFLNKYEIIEIKNDEIINKILDVLSLNINQIVKTYFCKTLNDFIVKLKDSNTLREIIVNENKIKKLNEFLKFRTLTITSKSDLNIFDYEARVFSVGLKNCEDIVCGSSSCYLSNLWSLDLLKKNLVALFPYNNYKKYFGGIEFIDMMDYDSFKLSGFVN